LSGRGRPTHLGRTLQLLEATAERSFLPVDLLNLLESICVSGASYASPLPPKDATFESEWES